MLGIFRVYPIFRLLNRNNFGHPIINHNKPSIWGWFKPPIKMVMTCGWIQGTDTQIWHVMWDEWKPLMCFLCSSYSYLRPQRTTLQSASHPDKNLWHGTRSQAPSKDIVWQHLCVHPHLDWRKPDSVGHLWGISWNFMQNILEREDLTVLGNHQCFAMWCFCAHQCGTGSEFSWDKLGQSVKTGTSVPTAKKNSKLFLTKISIHLSTIEINRSEDC